MKQSTELTQSQNRPNVSYLNNGRIPVIETDGLPIQYITVEKAQRVCTALEELDQEVNSMISQIKTYSHSAKYIIEGVKRLSQEDPDMFQKHYSQRQRLMGGTLHSMISVSLGEIEERIKKIRGKIGISEEVGV